MSTIDQLAETLFSKFQRDFPLTGSARHGPRSIKNLPQKRIEQRLEEFYREARAVRKSHGLWVVSWARVIRKLQRHLLDAGYPSEVVSKLLIATLFGVHSGD